MRISDWSSDVCSSDLILDLTAIGATVHADEAADSSGDRTQEFEPRDAGVAGGRGDEDARRTAAAAQRGRVDRLDLRERLAEPDDDAGEAAVANDEVRAEPERQQDRKSTRLNSSH